MRMLHPHVATSEIQLSRAAEEDSPAGSGTACTGGQETCRGNAKSLGTVLNLRGGGLVAQEASVPTSGGTGTGSDSAPPSQSPVLSEGGGEEHAVQGVDRTDAGDEECPRKRGKRKLPLPDLDAIEDVEERRRQRRLIKNRNTAAASRVRKQRELEELSQRMRSLEQDNASLRSHVDSRNAEIARLRAVVRGLQSTHGNPPHALPPSDGFSPLGPGGVAQQTMERGHQQDAQGEASHHMSAQPQSLHANHRIMSVAQSQSAPYRLGGPAGVWGDPYNAPGQEMGQQQQHAPHPPIHLQPALPEDQFAKAFGEQCRPGRAPPGQGRAAQVASSATSSLNASEQSAFAPAAEQHQPLPPARPVRMAAHRRGGGGTGDAEEPFRPADAGGPEAGAHADFLAFPWPELLEMVDEQERQLPPDAANGWQHPK